MNLAAVAKAPCVFYVQNNQWAISVPVHRQHAAPSIAARAVGYGMPGIIVDGNDVLACYAVMAEAAIDKTRGDIAQACSPCAAKPRDKAGPLF